MFKSTLLVTLFLLVCLLIKSSTAAAPPACVLACVNKQPTPADLESICGSEDAQTCLASECDNSKEVAVEFFKSTCESAGHQVAEPAEINSNSLSGSSSKTASGLATTATAATTTGSTEGNGSSASGTGSAGSSSTGIQEEASNSATSKVRMSGPLGVVCVAIGFFVLQGIM